jgi:hypothetical protein
MRLTFGDVGLVHDGARAEKQDDFYGGMVDSCA